MEDNQGRTCVRWWGLVTPGTDTTGTWIFSLPTDEDGVTRNKAFYGCSTKGECVGTFENCRWNGTEIPDGKLSLREWLGVEA